MVVKWRINTKEKHESKIEAFVPLFIPSSLFSLSLPRILQELRNRDPLTKQLCVQRYDVFRAGPGNAKHRADNRTIPITKPV